MRLVKQPARWLEISPLDVHRCTRYYPKAKLVSQDTALWSYGHRREGVPSDLLSDDICIVAGLHLEGAVVCP